MGIYVPSYGTPFAIMILRKEKGNDQDQGSIAAQLQRGAHLLPLGGLRHGSGAGTAPCGEDRKTVPVPQGALQIRKSLLIPFVQIG